MHTSSVSPDSDVLFIDCDMAWLESSFSASTACVLWNSFLSQLIFDLDGCDCLYQAFIKKQWLKICWFMLESVCALNLCAVSCSVLSAFHQSFHCQHFITSCGILL